MPLLNGLPGGGGGVNDTLPKQVPENEFTATTRMDLSANTLSFQVVGVSNFEPTAIYSTDYLTVQIVESIEEASVSPNDTSQSGTSIMPRLPNFTPSNFNAPAHVIRREPITLTWDTPSYGMEPVRYDINMKVDGGNPVSVGSTSGHTYTITDYPARHVPTVQLQWTKTDEYWAGAKIVKKLDSAPQGFKDGIVIYDGNDVECFDEAVEYGNTYYYRMFPYNSHKQLQSSMCVVEAYAPVEHTLQIELNTQRASVKHDGKVIPVGITNTTYLDEYTLSIDNWQSGTTLIISVDKDGTGNYVQIPENEYSSNGVKITTGKFGVISTITFTNYSFRMRLGDGTGA